MKPDPYFFRARRSVMGGAQHTHEPKAGDSVLFTTRFYPPTKGVVLAVDPELSYPIQVEHDLPNGGKTISRFHPAEFLSYRKE